MAVTLRPATLHDAESFAELRRMVMPYQVITPASTQHWWENATEAAKLLPLVAETDDAHDGAMVALGWACFNTWTSEEGAASIFVAVHPAHRGRGIGGRLYHALEGHLRDNGAGRLELWAVDDQHTLRWCARRGFERRHELRFSGLDLTDLDALPPVPTLPEGVTVATFAEVGPRGVYAIEAATILDEPGDFPNDAIPYEQWLTDIWQQPGVDGEASTVVLAGGVPVAYTLVEADHETRRIWSGGTGTLREHRGQGLAKIAKSIAVRSAARAGITAAHTSNDETNRPMLAINEWLGYRVCATQWSHLKTL